MIKIGSRVRIAHTSEYYTRNTDSNPRDVTGTVIDIADRVSHSLRVRWDNGKINSYRYADLAIFVPSVASLVGVYATPTLEVNMAVQKLLLSAGCKWRSDWRKEYSEVKPEYSIHGHIAVCTEGLLSFMAAGQMHEPATQPRSAAELIKLFKGIEDA